MPRQPDVTQCIVIVRSRVLGAIFVFIYDEKQLFNDKLNKSVFLSTLRDILFYYISNPDKHLTAR